MRRSFALLFLGLSLLASGQPPCACTAEEDATTVAADTVFVLDSLLLIACCGRIDRTGPEPLFSAFTLHWCGTSWPLLDTDTAAAFRLRVQERALVAEDLRLLPDGPELAVQPVVWRTHVIQGLYDPAIGEPVARISEFPGALRRLSKRERREVRTELEAVEATVRLIDDRLLGLLFLCAAQRASGAEQRFRSLGDRHGLQGAIAHRYAELLAMLDVLDAER